jgi:hypothetical protein
VLDYFDLCARFWSLDRGRLKEWSDAARAGTVPNFRANLNY